MVEDRGLLSMTAIAIKREALTSGSSLHKALQTWTIFSLRSSDDTQAHLVMIRLAWEVRNLQMSSL